VLLPCNVVVRETGPATTVVSFLDPASVLGLAQTAEPKQVAADARAMLDRVMQRLAG
jgi:uncharacterized protein (DUF302 family)